MVRILAQAETETISFLYIVSYVQEYTTIFIEQ